MNVVNEMSQKITEQNAVEIFAKADEKAAIFSYGYLMGKTGEKCIAVKTDRSYLDLIIKCSIGDFNFDTRAFWFQQNDDILETITNRLDEVIESWKRIKYRAD